MEGTVNLFCLRTNTDFSYFLQTKGYPLVKISHDDELIVDNKKYSREYLINRGIIQYFLKDCSELNDDINLIKTPSHNNLINL